MTEMGSENPTANLRTRATTAFLSWVGEAVNTGIPVIIQQGDKPVLSGHLQKVAIGFRMLGLKDEEMIDLAKAGEAAAQYEKALIENADKGRLAELQQQRAALWGKFGEDRRKTAKTYGLNDQQMLDIFRNLTKI